MKANLHALSLRPDDDPADFPREDEEPASFKWDDVPLALELPTSRFNAALAVGMDDKLYVYGGTYEVPGQGEITLDDFHVIDLGRLDGVRTLWNRTKLVVPAEEEEDDEDEIDEESGDSESEFDDDGIKGEKMEDVIVEGTSQPMVFDPSPELEQGTTATVDATDSGTDEAAPTTFNPAYPAPLPFETLKAYYDRTAKEWILLVVDARAEKAGRREAFTRAEGYWWECREEVREIEERMEESGVREVVAVQAERKDKRR